MGNLREPSQRAALVSAAAALAVGATSIGAVTWALVSRESTAQPQRAGAQAYDPADVHPDDLALELMASVQQRMDTAFLLIDSGEGAAASALLGTLADDVDLVVRLSDQSARAGSTVVRDALAKFLRAQREARATLASLRLPGRGVAALRGSFDRAAAALAGTGTGTGAAPVAPGTPATPVTPTTPTLPSSPPSVPAPVRPGTPGGVVPGAPLPTAVPSSPVTPALPSAAVPTVVPTPSLAPRPLPTLLPL